MASSVDDEKERWGQVMDHLDLLSQRLNDMGITQQEVKQQLHDTNLKVAQCTADQRFIIEQVKANGQAVAQLTLRQFEHDVEAVSEGSMIADDDTAMFENVFADKGKHTAKPGPSHNFKTHPPPPRSESIPHHALPKIHFPTSDGTQPTIWLDKCMNYFHIYKMPENMWVEAATMHLQDNASKWWQTYKRDHPAVTWKKFSADLTEAFGPDDHRTALNDLLDLTQTSTVEDYTTQFKSLQYDMSMHSSQYDPLFFATQYVRGLRDDIRAVVEPQVPTTVEKAAVIARIQQKVVDRQKLKYQGKNIQPTAIHHKQQFKPAPHYGNLWRDKQLRDYRKANNLCYHCGEKYDPGHAEVCAKRNKPQVNALALNDLDRAISEDMLNELAIDEALTNNFGQLSLNALSGTQSADSIQLKATVLNKTMLILVDTGSSHCFCQFPFCQLKQVVHCSYPTSKGEASQW